jgi:hypothetical protein
MSSFQVTNPNVRLGPVKPGESVAVTYTVANLSGGLRRATFRIQVKGEGGAFREASAGYSIGGENPSDFAVGATKQVTVMVAPPAKASPGTSTFRLFVGLVNSEDTDFDVGPEVTYDIAAAEKKPFPWLIVILAVVLLALVGGVLAYLGNRPQPGPSPTPQPIRTINNLCIVNPALCARLHNPLILKTTKP